MTSIYDIKRKGKEEQEITKQNCDPFFEYFLFIIFSKSALKAIFEILFKTEKNLHI